MKTAIFAALAALCMVGIPTSHAADPHHQLIIHGTLSTVLTTGTVNNIVKFPITNATLIKPFITGTSPAKDFDVTMDDITGEIDIIQRPSVSSTVTTPATVVSVVGDPENANTASEVHDTNPKHLGGYEVINTYYIFLPSTFASAAFGSNVPGPAVSGLFLKLGSLKNDTDEFAKNTAVFSGGYGEGQSNAYIISGVASTTSKTYTY